VLSAVLEQVLLLPRLANQLAELFQSFAKTLRACFKRQD
jgi:hypothetical protein